MASFVRLIEQFAIVLYLACLGGLIWAVRSAWTAMQDRNTTLYALEREAAESRAGRAIVRGLAFIALGAIIYFIARVVAPSLPAEDAPTPTLAGPVMTLTPTSTPYPTPTLEPSPTPNGTIDATLRGVESIEPPTPAPIPSASCPDPNVQITAPGNGQIFSGSFQVFGTANIPNFAFYKFVLNGPATNFENRTATDVFKSPVVNNYLGTLDPTIWLQNPGTYRVSLVAVDNVGNEAPPCAITLQILPAPPAP